MLDASTGPEAPPADRPADAAVDPDPTPVPDAPAELAGTPTDAGERDTGAPAEDDVTFFAFGDPQYGGGPGDKNSFHIQALNAAPELTWPRQVRASQRGPPGGRRRAG